MGKLQNDYWDRVSEPVKRAASSAVMGLESRHSPAMPSKGTHLREAVSNTSGTLTNGSIYFSDAAWTNYPARIYRIRSP